MSRRGLGILSLDVRWYVGCAILLMAAFSFRQFGIVVLRHTISICLIATTLDGAIAYLQKRKSSFPLSAFISGLIISSVLAPTRLFYLAPLIAILSKHIIKFSGRHIFNPAALGLLFVNIFFRLPLTWWLASNLYVVIPFGLFIAYKIKKFSLIFSFTASLFLLSVIYSLLTHLGLLANIGLINLFFIFFMLVEPKTSPLYVRGKLIYGAVAALLVVLSLWLFRSYDFLILGLVSANVAGVFLRKVG